MMTPTYMILIELFAAVMLDTLIGDPHRFTLHPVRIGGEVIAFFERALYKDSTVQGAIFCVLATASTAALASAATRGAHAVHPYLASIVRVALIWAAIAWRSLKDETSAIKDDLDAGDISSARRDLSMVVGRDTEALDERGVIRAAVETVGENAIDGIISPIFWLAAGALIGYPIEALWLFKSVSTQDSMVGYKNDRYRHFGTVSAKLDDVLNFIPARIGAICMMIGDSLTSGALTKEQIDGVMRDRTAHTSPNSAHGEAVMAWRLGICLGGPSTYGGVEVEKPYIGMARRDPVPHDIIRSHEITDRGTSLFLIVATAFVLVAPHIARVLR